MTDRPNTYDKKDRVQRGPFMRAGSLKLAAYRVRDPETDEWSSLQFHMTFDNCVMAVMEEEAAKLFARFVGETLNLDGLGFRVRDGSPEGVETEGLQPKADSPAA